MFEKNFDLVGWIHDLDGELEGKDVPQAVETFADYLNNSGGAYRESNANTERRRELAFMLHLTARLNQYLVAQLVAETPK